MLSCFSFCLVEHLHLGQHFLSHFFFPFLYFRIELTSPKTNAWTSDKTNYLLDQEEKWEARNENKTTLSIMLNTVYNDRWLTGRNRNEGSRPASARLGSYIWPSWLGLANTFWYATGCIFNVSFDWRQLCVIWPKQLGLWLDFLALGPQIRMYTSRADRLRGDTCTHVCPQTWLNWARTDICLSQTMGFFHKNYTLAYFASFWESSSGLS